MIKHLDDYTQAEDASNSMVESRTVLISKDTKREMPLVKPIFNLLWNLLTSITNEKVYDHLNQQNLLPEKQKVCWRITRRTKDKLLTVKEVVRNSGRRKTNLNEAWFDFGKAYNMVPHSWTLNTLELVGTATNVIEMLKGNMQSWITVLFPGKNRLGKVIIRRGIFQGDSVTLVICGCSNSCYNNP